jgi:predicted negative regulator of RcsB-dependent stress response
MTKRELREDPVMESIQKGLDFARSNTRWLVLGIVAVVVVIAVGAMVLQGRKAAARRATVELAQARTQVFGGQLDQARAALETLVARGRGTPSALEAQLLLGDIYLRLGQPADAKTSFEEALRNLKDPLVRSGALRGLAAALEDMGNKAEASSRYEEAAAGENVSALSDLMNAARTAADGGDLVRARALYERCLTMAEELARGRVSEIQGLLAEIDARGGGASGTVDAREF